MSKYKVKSLMMTWNGVTYKVRSMPAGKGQSSDPVDVTTLDDVEYRFIPGALANNKEFQVVAQGLTEAPAINTQADMTLNIVFNDGSEDATKTVTIPACILKDIDPPAADATGDRGANWTLTFQPGGSDPSSGTGGTNGTGTGGTGTGGTGTGGTGTGGTGTGGTGTGGTGTGGTGN